MRLYWASSLAALILALAAASCTQQTSAPSEAPSVTNPDRPVIIRLGLNNNISSGLPVLHPAIMTLNKGAVTAFRAGIPDAEEALNAIKAGNPVEDTQERRQNIQAAFEKLLSADNIALDTIADPDGNTLLLFSPDEDLGECAPCTALFQGLEAGGTVGGFSIRSVVIEHR